MDHVKLESAIRDRSAADVATCLLDGGLERMAAGRSEVRAVRHPLGFICVPMSRSRAEVGVCIHLWHETDVPTVIGSAVHCHSWDLLSFVQTGCIVNQRHGVVRRDGGAYRMYEIRTADGHDEFTMTDERADVTIGHRGVYRVGECYELPAGEFHTSELLSPNAITVVMGRYRPGARDLGMVQSQAIPRVRRRVPFDFGQSTEVAAHLLDRMAVA